MSTDLQAEIHAWRNSQDCVFSDHSNWASGPHLEKAAILKTLIFLYLYSFHCWTEYEQPIIIRFLLNENVHLDDTHRRLQARFTDDARSILSVRVWCQFIRKGWQGLTEDPRSTRPAINLLDTRILSALKSYFIVRTHFLRSWVFLIQQSFTTCEIHLEWKFPFALGPTWVGSWSAWPPIWNLRATTASLGNERARLISNVGHKGWELICVRVPGFNKIELGARSYLNEGQSNTWYNKGHIHHDFGNWRISRRRYDPTRGCFNTE
jgi:hypothetical protein